MSVADPVWTSAPAASPAVRLVQVPPAVLQALAAGDRETAARLADVEITPYVAGPECRRIWEIRHEQLAATPGDQPWVTRLVVGPDGTVGLAGFHGAPDHRGMVEIGYRVEPALRRRGYARAALQLMLDVADDDSRVDVVRATISPDNLASRTLVHQYGFCEVGEQWDDEDGLETIFERTVQG